MNEKIRGKIIGFTLNGKKTQCEISSDFSFDVEMRNASAVTSGRWKEVIPGLRSWQMSVNANLLKNATGTGYIDILNLLLNGTVANVQWATDDGDFVISGTAYLSGGGSNAPLTGTSQWNATFIGSGAIEVNGEAPVEETVRWTYQSDNPFGDEATIVYKFNKSYNPLSPLSLDFTKLSTGSYLAFSVPTGYPDFNIWENNVFNSGTIPDFVWRDKVTISGRDIYISQDPIFFTSDVPIIIFKNKSTTPNAYIFNDITSALRSTEYISNEITVAGITEPVPIVLTGGLGYNVNGGSYTTTDGYVSNGDKVRVKLMTSGSFLTTVSATLTIGGVSDAYDVTTQEDASLFYAYASDVFTRNDCTLPQEGNSVPFSRTYNGATQMIANTAKSTDAAQFILDGQANANSIGVCAVPGEHYWGKITEEDVENFGASRYANVYLRIYKGTSSVTPPTISPVNLAPLPIPSILMQYRQEGASPFTPFTFSPTTLGVSEILLITPNQDPLLNPLYPKQLIWVDGGATYMYFAPPGKLRDEVFYIGSF